jgi:hypothetical protein
MCAFPLQVWTLILIFRDFSWVSERTNSWDAFGVASYGMIFAFVESLLVFLIAVVLGFLISRKWGEDRRIALLSILILVAAFWAMFSQLYFLLEISVPEQILSFLVQSKHPVRVMYATGLPLIVFTFILPAYLIIRSNRVYRFVQGLIERLSLLTMLYLFLDFAGLVIIILRNI